MVKYCPFNLVVKQVIQTIREYNGDGMETMCTEKLVETQRPTECRKKGCACYRFGRCIKK